MEAATVPASQKSAEDKPPREGADLIKSAARGDKLTDVEQQDALSWFLADEEEDLTEEIQINVGTRKKAHWITWEIKPVDLDALRKIRKNAQGSSSRREKRAGQVPEVDETAANLQIVVQGTVAPDLKVIAKEKGIVDPADALRFRFARRPGLLAQIAGEIMSISGYDDEDIREVDAAGNS